MVNLCGKGLSFSTGTPSGKTAGERTPLFNMKINRNSLPKSIRYQGPYTHFWETSTDSHSLLLLVFFTTGIENSLTARCLLWKRSVSFTDNLEGS